MPNTLDPRALCSLADVKQYIGGEANSGTTRDDLLTRLINAASDEIYAFTQREFVAIGSNPQTRTLDLLDELATPDNRVWVGDLATAPSAITVKNRNGDVLQSINLAEVNYLPRLRQSNQPITHIRLRNYYIWTDFLLDITGTWGFPSIPEKVRQAAITTVNIWYARDVERFSGTFSITEDRVELPRALPAQVVDSLRSFRVDPVG